MKVAIDAVGIRDGGGAAILEELLYWLPRVRPDWQWHVFLLDRKFRKFDTPVVGPNVTLEMTRRGNTGFGRIVWVNALLPRRLQATRADLLFSFANIAPFRPSIPQVVFCHQLLIFSTDTLSDFPLGTRIRLRFLRNFIWRGIKHTQTVIVQTDNMRDRLIMEETNLRDRVKVIPSGFRTPPARPVVRDTVRSIVDECPHPRLLYVSLLRFHKNHALLVRSLKRIAQVQPNVRLMLTVDPAAPHSTDIAHLQAQLMTEVEHSGVKDRVVWLGHLTPDEVAYALGASDVMVFPSLAESFGLPLVESMAAGCPIAASDLPYAHNVAGLAAEYFDPNDADSVADRVLRLLSSTNRQNELRAEAMKRRKLFSYDSIADQMATAFEEAVSKRSSNCGETVPPQSPIEVNVPTQL